MTTREPIPSQPEVCTECGDTLGFLEPWERPHCPETACCGFPACQCTCRPCSRCGEPDPSIGAETDICPDCDQRDHFAEVSS